jgi:hypothetical protein
VAYNFTIGASGRWGIAALAFQNPHPSVIYDVASSNNQHDSSGAAQIDVNSITTLNNNSIWVGACGADGSANVFNAVPGGWTQRARVDTDQTLIVASQVIATPSSTGTSTFTYTTSNGAFSFSFALRDNGTTTFRSASTNSGSTGTAVSVTEPAGVAAGDLVIVVIHCNGVTTIVDNNGGAFTEDVNDYQETTAGLTASLFSRRIASAATPFVDPYAQRNVRHRGRRLAA